VQQDVQPNPQDALVCPVQAYTYPVSSGLRIDEHRRWTDCSWLTQLVHPASDTRAFAYHEQWESRKHGMDQGMDGDSPILVMSWCGMRKVEPGSLGAELSLVICQGVQTCAHLGTGVEAFESTQGFCIVERAVSDAKPFCGDRSLNACVRNLCSNHTTGSIGGMRCSYYDTTPVGEMTFHMKCLSSVMVHSTLEGLSKGLLWF
jgi:hypothetical protein